MIRSAPPTVRDGCFAALRRCGLTTIFSNPGSTEVALLGDLPDDLRFVMALHEGSVVGLATGYALGRDAAALVVLHTTAGLGNAVGALATARVNRAPLVVIVGQQDRRHLAHEPFLAGHLAGLAGQYPVWVDAPVRATDVPAAIERAFHEATTHRGPALVIVPMDDWSAPFDEGAPGASATAIARGAQPAGAAVGDLVALLDAAARPALVVGAGADGEAAWAALVACAEALAAPVYQESFGARAGFPQDHPRFAGHLPADRTRLRALLGAHDLVVVVGAGAFRQYPYDTGQYVPDGTDVVVVTAYADEAHRSPARFTVLADVAATMAAVAARLRPRRPAVEVASAGAVAVAVGRGVAPPAPGAPLRAAHVLAALAEVLPADAVVVEECPSARPDLHRIVPARAPLGFLSAAHGGLGFALPAAMGVRLACPGRPVVAVLGDGSALYQVQALWSAAHYGIGVVVIVLANGRYAIMDRLVERAGTKAPWPGFEEVSLSTLAAGFGVAAHRLDEHAALRQRLSELIPTAAQRAEPIVLEVAVAADDVFLP